MWIKHLGVYYNLDRASSVSFRKESIAFNAKTSSYVQVRTRFPFSDKQLKFLVELWESALLLDKELFDLDKLYDQLKPQKRKRS